MLLALDLFFEATNPSSTRRAANVLNHTRGDLGLDDIRHADNAARLYTGSNFERSHSPAASSNSGLRQQSSSTQTDGRRRKRRKLDSDDKREGIRGFSYGHFGQVVPGTLGMEIASCDGGRYEVTGESSWPENVLTNDSSVYCTKSDRCNLILRHRGETPFCLNKLVIRAPKTGYDAPSVFFHMFSFEY